MRLWIALMVLTLSAAPSMAADPIRVSASASVDDKMVAERLAAAVKAELSKASGYIVVDTLPQAKLILYANKDVNDGKNPDGWSIAIAHVSNVETYFLASKLLKSEQSDVVAAKPLLTQMVNETGFISHLSVAHIDALTDANITALAHSVVIAFLAKIPKTDK